MTHVNTRGDEAGWVAMPGGGVTIANVAEDVSADNTGAYAAMNAAEPFAPIQRRGS